MQWFLTLFTSLPCWDSVLAIWDLVMLHGIAPLCSRIITPQVSSWHVCLLDMKCVIYAPYAEFTLHDFQSYRITAVFTLQDKHSVAAVFTLHDGPATGGFTLHDFYNRKNRRQLCLLRKLQITLILWSISPPRTHSNWQRWLNKHTSAGKFLYTQI